MAINVSGFNVPETPYRNSEVIDRLVANQWRNKEWQYRMQQQQDQDQWRKLNLIQDLTDLSKHQTGSDVADAIGNQQAGEIFQKYTQAAANMSPVELQANVQKDMMGTMQGMDAIKNELNTSDQQLQKLKALYPSLDMGALTRDARADVLHRRLDNSGGFVNPMQVPQSQMNFADPDFLSKYVAGDKNLRDYFQNPKGLDDVSVFKGNPNNYTKFTAKIPPYKKPNFDPNTLKGGFMTTSGEPQLQFKSSVLPSDALPNSKSQPFEMMDKDVLDNLGGTERLELIGNTRKLFPNYDQMNQTEKEYAQRNTLLRTAKSLDNTNFHPTEVHTPSASLLKFYAGEKGKGEGDVNINDVYDKLDKSLANWESQGSDQFMPFQNAPQEVKDALLPKIKENDNYKDATQNDLQIIRGNDNSIRVFDREGNFVMSPTPLGTNLKAQPAVKEKREVIRKDNQQKANKDPLGLGF